MKPLIYGTYRSQMISRYTGRSAFTRFCAAPCSRAWPGHQRARVGGGTVTGPPSGHTAASEDEAIVEFMVAFGLANRPLPEHVDDGTGHYRGCTLPQTPRPIFPCSIYFYAARASKVERHPRESPTSR